MTSDRRAALRRVGESPPISSPRGAEPRRAATSRPVSLGRKTSRTALQRLSVRGGTFDIRSHSPGYVLGLLLKTPHSRRTIGLPRVALDALTSHRDNDGGATEGWLFPTKHGNPVDAHNFIHRPLERMLRKAGLPGTTRYHDLRRGAASLLLSQGVPVPAVSNYLGHRDSSTALSVYAHRMDGMAAQGMDDIPG